MAALSLKSFMSPCAACQGCSEKQKFTDLESGGQYLVVYEKELDLLSSGYLHLANNARWTTQANYGKPMNALKCGDRIRDLIKKHEIHHVFCLGTTAIKAVILRANTSSRVNPKTDKFVGSVIPDRELQAWIYCLPDVEHFHNGGNAQDILSTAKLHYQNTVEEYPKPLQNGVTNTTISEQDMLFTIKNALESEELIGIDYETTGLKPHNDGHEIVSVALCYKNITGKWVSTSSPFFNTSSFRRAWKDILMSGRCVAHNVPFEINWSYKRAGYNGEEYWCKKFAWDTCIAAHCIDNNGLTGLKHVAYRDLGVQWDEGDTDLSAETSNGFNAFKGRKITPKDLAYNAYDALYMMILYEVQKKWFDEHPDCLKGFQLFMDGAYELSKVSMNGIYMNIEQMEQTRREAQKKQNQILRAIYSDPVCVKLGIKDLNKRSELGVLCRHLGFDLDKLDKENLRSAGHPLLESLLEYRKWFKVTNTYLNQFQNEIDQNGQIHPFFELNKVVTFRSSSSNPNFQNIPKRDKEVMKMIRSIIMPSPGNCIMEFDYKAVEVAMSCCYHKDPNMINYVSDPKTDMHRDVAATICCKDPKDISKVERQIGKNGFVFPQFYGASWESCEENIWAMLSEDSPATIDHLLLQGISKTEMSAMRIMKHNREMELSTWQAHIVKVQQHFWEVRFPYYSSWKREMFEDFKKSRVIKLHSGFECRGYAGFTEATNRPIQGSAFHALLFTLTKSAPIIAGLSGRSRIIGQIHDSIVGDIHPDEIPQVIDIVNNYGTKLIRKKWDWINVPLTIEVEKGEVDQSWTTLKGV
jgi:DNA polymerase I-like protein with 3'-5' exonuclease and polymerase domains